MGPKPSDLSRPEVRAILDEVRGLEAIGSRIDAISRHFIGFPYLEGPLVGSSTLPERLTASLGGFDCVTYVESVLALARASTATGFVENLRRIRYAGGDVDWRRRNHYMTAWIRNNQSAGIVRNRTRGAGLVERDRRLNVVEGMPARNVRVRSVRKREFMRRADETETGDIAFFASTRTNLDVFHVGLLVRSEDRVVLRHAARSRGRVVEEGLRGFLVRNRMAGVILVRPQLVAGGKAA